jgi:two-component system chemotaxis sensor kinase CheA
MDINAKVLAAFQAEHKEQIEAIRSIVAKGGGAGDEAFNEALRLAHTMKAGARVCGLDGVRELAHRLETLFAQIRDHKVALDDGAAAAVSSALDVIEDSMASVGAGNSPAYRAPALRAIDRALNGGTVGAPKRSLREGTKLRVLAAFQSEQREHLAGIRVILAKTAPGNGVLAELDLDEVLRLTHTLKGGARISGLQTIETLSHQLESVFVRIKSGSLKLDPAVMEVVTVGLNSIEDWMGSLAANETPAEPARALDALGRLLGLEDSSGGAQTAAPEAARSAAPSAGVAQQFDTVRLSAEHLDRLLQSSGQIVTESLRQDQVSRALADLSLNIEEIDREWESVREVSAAHLHRLSATPEFTRVLHYLEFVERQTRVISKQARQLRAVQQRSSRAVRVLGQELQENVRKARMIPAEGVFGVFRKMVRDMAADENKSIEFLVSGLDVQADRMVLQALKDPVMHMLRNSIGHGMERPDERKRSGKAECGCVTLQVEAVGNRLTILVDDDGRGLDLSRVAEVAVRKGLLSQAEAGARSSEELSSLIFQPGFSTAKTITDLSGRGMGLSVVYEAVSRLQGEVRVAQKAGPGNCMVISVPLSISTHRLLLVSSHGQTFAIPSAGIQRLIRIKLTEVETVEGKPIIVWEGQSTPLASLAQLLGIGGESDFTVEGKVLSIMILKSGNRRLAVAVDAFVAEREAIIKNLDAPVSGISILAGGIVLEDGSVSLVLNTGELIESFKPVYAPPTSRAGGSKTDKKASTVLVVDDSFTARTLEKSILEVHGYNVVVAIDGLEGLSKLRSEEIDLVISDIQMPRMDGLALLQEMKRDERFARLPVILVTSMNHIDDQERGLALGADAYLVKQRFDHQTLLDTIKQLL